MRQDAKTEVETARDPKRDIDQWVVKGTNSNCHRYLRRKWSPVRAQWVARQSAADRFYLTDAERETRAHGGVVVKLVAPAEIIEQVSALNDFIFEQAKGAQKRKVLHWIHGVGELRGSRYTEGDCFCRECAGKVVDKLKKRFPKKSDDVNLCVDGGWGSEEDGPRYCELCGSPLQHSLTDYGVEEEFNHFRMYPPKSGAPEVWAAISLAVQNLPDDSPLWVYISRWVRANR